MTDANFPLTADDDFDDLPRTLRRERAARAARERERRERDMLRPEAAFVAEAPPYLSPARPAADIYGDRPLAASVRRFDVPFLHLVLFFLKSALAAIPALILLGAVLYYAGKGLEAHYPGLLPLKIVIASPGG